MGSGVQPAEEVRFLARYLLAGDDGLCAARTVDRTIRRLPGFAGVRLLEDWLTRQALVPRSALSTATAAAVAA